MGFAKAFKLGPRIHAHYWGCSNFSKWITKTFADPQYIKPYSATFEYWQAWRELYSVNHPKTYWVTEVALDAIQNVVYYPVDLYYNIRYYIKNRWISKTHLIILPSVEPGTWAEFDQRILEAGFQLLVNFVEQESSVKELEGASKLTYDEDWNVGKNDPRYGTPTQQAIDALKILELYNWWKARMNWADPWEAWHKIEEASGRSLWEKQSDASKAAMDAASAEEERRYEEETQKLIELVSIRRSLWT